ncbi:MAG: CHAT domain-containing protein, partial [Candidatus Eisenbacteria sp.]|nr:CHAT domain-containing protein [Candidatus Eisenbacteria bacterium]
RIHDEATEVLMDAFYQNYMAGARRDPASALTQASRAVRESWNHPFYWGSFSVHGD